DVPAEHGEDSLRTLYNHVIEERCLEWHRIISVLSATSRRRGRLNAATVDASSTFLTMYSIASAPLTRAPTKPSRARRLKGRCLGHASRLVLKRPARRAASTSPRGPHPVSGRAEPGSAGRPSKRNGTTRGPHAAPHRLRNFVVSTKLQFLNARDLAQRLMPGS